jgi:hypothetical protein
MQEIGSLVKAGAKKPPAVGLLDSVVMVVMLMRRNATLWGSRTRPLVLTWGSMRPAHTR